MSIRVTTLSFFVGALVGATTSAAATSPSCDADNAGLDLPPGFCALVVADDLGPARHLAVAENGDVYVAVRHRGEPGKIVALRDTDEDGRADVTEHFDDVGGTGLRLHDGFLYLGRTDEVVRYRMTPGKLVPDSAPETVAKLPQQRSHAAKGLAFDGEGGLFVNIGAPSNACQKEDRKEGQPGQDPCPLLESYGGVWKFDAQGRDQTPSPATRYATGMRQNFAMAWHPFEGGLYLVQHGCDQLNTLWPELFTTEQNAELPSEELLRVEEGSDFGWPYCHHDWQQGKRVLAPEYGGDGKKVGRCDQYPPPLLGFPGHWAPNDLLFYRGRQFPERYRGGAFVVFHGSWNRAPLPQGGYNVVFVEFDGKKPRTGEYEIFADGFAGTSPLVDGATAEHRPSGIAEGPDGSLYIANDKTGRLWRVLYRGTEGR